MKKKLIVLAVFLLAATVYFLFYNKNKTLRYVTENADVVVLVDVKNLTRQYISDLAMHPSQWFDSKNNKENTISIQESGVKIPDFFQAFHIKNTRFSQWYSIFEITDQQKFLRYLKQQKFIVKGKDAFQKDQMYIKIDAGKCIVGTSDLSSVTLNQLFFNNTRKMFSTTDSFIDGSLGSISFISESQIQNFSINLNSDEIEIKSASNSKDFSLVISKVHQKNTFLETELDAENIRKFTSFFDKDFAEYSHINYGKVSAELEQVNDTIITYGYDDNFNEIEKKSFQKIIQPNYVISFESSDPQKTLQYFENKKWINTQNQFTAIPFQPNSIKNIKNQFEIKSTRQPISLSQKLNQNYIFIRNNALLLSSFKSLTTKEKKLLSDLEYIFYGNHDQEYYLKLKFKKEERPLLLRW